jgi:eukaryotic-like serine/threonine-protein kinase
MAWLYEMFTGRKAFAGKTRAGTLGAILKDQPPPISSVQPLAPPALDYIVRACLAKDPEHRFQSAHDLLLQLQWIAEAGSASLLAPGAPRRGPRERLAWITAGVMAAIAMGVGALAIVRSRDYSAPVEPVQLAIVAAQNSTLATPLHFTVSPGEELTVST